MAIVFVGTTQDTESEGHDREDMGLPGRQQELIQHVAAAKDSTIVVVNAAAPVDTADETRTSPGWASSRA